MRRLASLVFVSLMTAWFAPKVAYAMQPPALVQSAATPQERGAPVPLSTDTRDTYAERETASAGLGDFRGGGVSIYLGSGVLLAIVIVLLLVILI